ncbi:FitA-like ribbon-helix-helix domain-containing protein [Candidatus Poriferisocius sp.]|uniref:FitA-like ribbon-helix-helix domain-containing protein n=1 Tax=Candidatus Poriferisocius sp. TaxID=3101276 RepID=UPI003B010899
MANLQVRNVPDVLHERLRQHALERNCTMSAAVLDAIERELARWEWSKHLSTRPTTDLGIEVASLIAEVRASRDSELE